jgi:hypothetical protein
VAFPKPAGRNCTTSHIDLGDHIGARTKVSTGRVSEFLTRAPELLAQCTRLGQTAADAPGEFGEDRFGRVGFTDADGV